VQIAQYCTIIEHRLNQETFSLQKTIFPGIFLIRLGGSGVIRVLQFVDRYNPIWGLWLFADADWEFF